MKLRALVLASGLALVARPAPAAEDDLTRAKAYFKAGAAAYTAGDYQAAIQALDAAYQLTPLPAIAFSLAQAERRQYFVSRERGHLDRAIELYRVYLTAVPTGGRRADATDALAQLEPLALASANATGSVAAAAPGAEVPGGAKTRLLVTTEAPNATVSLDGRAAVPSPLIAEVTPGQHAVKVEARGYFPVERGVVAVSGALVPIEVPLEIRPATVSVAGPPDADLYVDGVLAGKVSKTGRIELPGGSHAFTFAQKGHRLSTLQVELEPGETREVRTKLVRTSQRTAAYVTLAASAVSLGASAVLAGLAFGQQRKAEDIREQQMAGNVTPEALDEYDEALDRRSQFRTAAIVSGAVFAGTLITAICLHEFDHPTVHEAPPAHKERPRDTGSQSLALVDGPGEAGAALRLSF
jgi:tetratricopeptide (TPR) repeat protein